MSVTHTNEHCVAAHTALDRFSSAVFGIEPTRKVAFMNSSGLDIVNQRKWVEIASGLLTAGSRLTSQAHLQNALQCLCTGAGFKTVVTDSRSGTQALVQGQPIPAPMTCHHPVRVAAVVWISPLAPRADMSADLAQLFGLTPAEQRLAARLSVGDELRAAADKLNISINTARTQLKSIFSKTGRRTQAALLALTVQISALRS